MYELMREENGKPVLFEWMLARQKTFEAIKAKLIMTLMIVYSDFDKSFILYMDVSDRSVRAILYQKGDDKRE